MNFWKLWRISRLNRKFFTMRKMFLQPFLTIFCNVLWFLLILESFYETFSMNLCDKLIFLFFYDLRNRNYFKQNKSGNAYQRYDLIHSSIFSVIHSHCLSIFSNFFVLLVSEHMWIKQQKHSWEHSFMVKNHSLIFIHLICFNSRLILKYLFPSISSLFLTLIVSLNLFFLFFFSHNYYLSFLILLNFI